MVTTEDDIAEMEVSMESGIGIGNTVDEADDLLLLLRCEIGMLLDYAAVLFLGGRELTGVDLSGMKILAEDSELLAELLCPGGFVGDGSEEDP